jgi:hypothetical protein
LKQSGLGAIGRGTKNSGGLANGAENYSAAKSLNRIALLQKLSTLMVLLKLRSGNKGRSPKGAAAQQFRCKTVALLETCTATPSSAGSRSTN